MGRRPIVQERETDRTLRPNLGLYLDRPFIDIPNRGLADCMNLRVKQGRLIRDNMGYTKFTTKSFENPVLLIDGFFLRDGTQKLIIATTRDVYNYNENTDVRTYLNLRYETGTVAVTNGSAIVTGTGTTWSTNVKAGDFFHSGATGQNDPDATWYEIDSVDSNTQITLTTNFLGSTDTGLAYTTRKTFTGDKFNIWDSEIFPNAVAVQGTDGDRWYGTNFVDDVIAWDGSSDQIYEPPIGFRCRTISRFKNMLLFGNLIEGGVDKPYTQRNSAIGEPENVSTKEAGENVVHDGVDPIIVIFTLGDNAVIYSERSIVLVQFVGASAPDLVFVFRTAISSIGPLSARSVSDFGNFHQFLSSDGQYQFDGISLLEVGTHVFRDVLRTISPQRLDQVLSHFDEENGELVWVIPVNSDADPSTGTPEIAYTEHYLESIEEREPTPIMKREVPATATGYWSRLSTLTFDAISTGWDEQNFRWNDQFFQAAFPFNLFGDVNGNIFILNGADAQDGSDITSFARFGRKATNDGIRKGIVKRVYPYCEKVDGGGNLDVNLYGVDQAAGAATLLRTAPYDLSHSGNNFASFLDSCRFLQIEFKNTGQGVPWTLQGYDIHAVGSGER